MYPQKMSNLIFLFLLIKLISSTQLSHLSGANSYLKYPPWVGGASNNTLTFDFQTNQPDGLLVYTDDQGASDFFELKLVEGSLRLRYNLGDGTQLLSVGRHLNDGLWHRAEIRVGAAISITVDGFVTVSRSVSKGESFNGNKGNVWVGGLSEFYNNKLGELSLPSVVFEPRWRGGIRNLIYDGGVVGYVEAKGLVTTGVSACERHDPCKNGGFCVSTDNGAVCDCKNIEFEGEWCEKDSPPATATFTGSSFIGYDFRQSGGEPIISTLDEVAFSFKCIPQPHEVLLFYSGDSVDYLSITLNNGRVHFSINLGSGPLDARIHPDHLRFDDGMWHSLKVQRKVQEISKFANLCHITASIDGIHFDRWTLAGSFTLLSSNRVTVGGYEMLRPLPGVKGVANFVGCLKKVEYRADTLRLSLLELARERNRLISIGGRVEWGCEVGGTNVGLLGNNAGSGEISGEVVKQLTGGTVTFTTPESYLFLRVNASEKNFELEFKIRTTEPSGLILYAFDEKSTSMVSLELINTHLYLHLSTPTSGTTHHLRLLPSTDPLSDASFHTILLKKSHKSGSIQIDQSQSTQFNLKSAELPLTNLYIGSTPSDIKHPKIWSMNLRQGFVGCIRSFTLNNVLIDLSAHAQMQDSASVRSGCHLGASGNCASNPCLNGGRCRDGWGRSVCECGGPYGGVVCQKIVEVVSLDGSREIDYDLAEFGEANSLKLKFKSVKANGVILSLKGVNDFVEISLVGTRLKAKVKISENEKILQTGKNLNDDKIHYLIFTRYGNLITIKLDDIPPVSTEILTKKWEMNLSRLTLNNLSNRFHGKIYELKINNLNYLKYKNTLTDVAYLKDFVTFPQLRFYSKGEISFSFKSTVGGVIFYNGGVEDYIYLEIGEHGELVLGGDFGGGRWEVRSGGSYFGGWRYVEVIFDYKEKIELRVDGVGVGGWDCGGEVVELNGVMYVGGAPTQSYQKTKSNAGFRGCVAGLEFGGEYFSALTDALGNNANAIKGCQETNVCTTDTCKNGGSCLATGECNCDLTSFVGSDCSGEPPTYNFHTTSKLTYNNFKSFKFLAFGLVTKSSDATLLKLNSKQDFLELSLVGGRGKLTLHFEGNSNLNFFNEKKLNDGVYHVLRVVKEGGFIYFIVDGVEGRRRVAGEFSGVGVVSVGGFEGQLSGLVINSEKIFDLIERKDPRIKIHGNVNSNLLNYMQKTTASHTPSHIHDDLISSGDIKCYLTTDDEDCLTTSSGMATDELITPVYTPAPKPKTTTVSTTTTFSKRCEGDDEDCFLVEGSGETTVTIGRADVSSTHVEITETSNPTTTSTTSTSSTTTIKNTPPPTTTTTTKATTTTSKTTTHKASTTTKFIPPHPPSLTPRPKLENDRVFDFEQITTTPPPTTTEDHTIYLGDPSGDSTLIIIITVAVLMIVVVSILILFFMCKRREDPIYKVEAHQSQIVQSVHHGGGGMGGGGVGSRAKGVKEWYV